jgi:phosphoribosylaminoimidazole carboxylase (NCAIR synthetase)
MVLTLEKIKQTNKFEQQDIQTLLESIDIITSDNEKSISRKLSILTSMREAFSESTDIDSLSDIQALNFLRFISKLNVQIELYEVLEGKKDLDSLIRASKRFAQKTKSAIGMTD